MIIKRRVKSILSCGKPIFGVAVAAIIVAITAVILLSVNPSAHLSGEKYETGYSSLTDSGTDYDGVELTMRALTLDTKPTILTVTWHNNTDMPITFGDHYWIYKYENGKWVSCAAEKSIAFDDIGYTLEAGNKKIKNYYNYGFDLSREGAYRLESYFIFDKDTPVMKENNNKVWLEFEISDKVPAAVLDTGIYAASDVLFINPLHSNDSSQHSNLLYIVEPDSFHIAHSQKRETIVSLYDLDWHAEYANVEEWYGMFPDEGVDIGGYASRTIYDIGGVYKLFLMDGRVWLGETKGSRLLYLYKLEKTDISDLEVTGSEVPSIPENETLCVDSPDGAYRAEAFGTNKGITAGGLYPYEGQRLIRSSDEKILWSDEGYYTAEFLWSSDSRYVAVYREARTFGECLIIEAATGKVTQLPDFRTISKYYDNEEQPDDDRPAPYFMPIEWQDDKTIQISYSWSTAAGKNVSGTFTFNIESGDIVVGASEQ